MYQFLKREVQESPIYSAIIMIMFLSVPFLAFPEMDIWFSGLFYDPDHGFWLSSVWFFDRLRDLGIFTVRMVINFILLFLVARLIWPDLKKLFALADMLVLTFTALLGSGILVHWVLKDLWGRARPIQTDIFGGQWPFTEIWIVAGNCPRNCSFVSGEGSMTFWLLGLLLLLPVGWRKVSFWIIATFGILLSLNRVAFGGHYISDIFLSWAITGLVMAIFYTIFKRDTPLSIAPERLEAAWDYPGTLVRQWLARDTPDPDAEEVETARSEEN